MAESPGVTGVTGEPGVVVVHGLPSVVSGTEYRAGVTGACSEYTGRLTDDC